MKILIGSRALARYVDSIEPNDNPEEALKATHKALLMVSEQVNIGMESAVYLEEYENTTKIIFK